MCFFYFKTSGGKAWTILYQEEYNLAIDIVKLILEKWLV